MHAPVQSYLLSLLLFSLFGVDHTMAAPPTLGANSARDLQSAVSASAASPSDPSEPVLPPSGDAGTPPSAPMLPPSGDAVPEPSNPIMPPPPDTTCTQPCDPVLQVKPGVAIQESTMTGSGANGAITQSVSPASTKVTKKSSKTKARQ